MPHPDGAMPGMAARSQRRAPQHRIGQPNRLRVIDGVGDLAREHGRGRRHAFQQPLRCRKLEQRRRLRPVPLLEVFEHVAFERDPECPRRLHETAFDVRDLGKWERPRVGP